MPQARHRLVQEVSSHKTTRRSSHDLRSCRIPLDRVHPPDITSTSSTDTTRYSASHITASHVPDIKPFPRPTIPGSMDVASGPANGETLYVVI